MKTEHCTQIEKAVAAVAEKAKSGIHHFYFVACGGSQAFMMSVQYMFDREIGIPSSIYTSNEFNYGTPKDFDEHSVVITCSHSGTTPETVEAAKRATEIGAVSIALTNEIDSPLAKAAMYPIHYDHGADAAITDKNKAVLYALAFGILKVVAPEQAARWESGLKAIDALEEATNRTVEKFKEAAVAWGKANKRDSIIYTMGSGVNYGEMYSLAICLFMEMQWINSSCIHSGEYFHGPFEITDYDVPFIITISNGATRHLDERACSFCKKFSDNVFVIDEADFDMAGIDESVREYYAPLVLGGVIRTMVDSIAHERGHALSVRRYMWQMEY
ncbi:MAG: SIS domain-containing protein [Clostridiales bacterium]|nr:SIS domain-containing protein [Clostridiales bacterium]